MKRKMDNNTPVPLFGGVEHTHYRPSLILPMLFDMARQRMTEREMVDELRISRSTLDDWKRRYPEVRQALRDGLEARNKEVELALLKSAVGYDYDEEQAFIFRGSVQVVGVRRHKPANGTDALKWLERMSKRRWAAEKKVKIEGEISHTHALDLGKLSREELRALRDIQRKALIEGVVEDVVAEEIEKEEEEEENE